MSKMVIMNLIINLEVDALKQSLRDRHYLREPGGWSYHGQTREQEE